MMLKTIVLATAIVLAGVRARPARASMQCSDYFLRSVS